MMMTEKQRDVAAEGFTRTSGALSELGRGNYRPDLLLMKREGEHGDQSS
jgi:hypothetical protein